jgi:alpha-L-fucosidase
MSFKKTTFLLLAIALFACKSTPEKQAVESPKYKADWESLKQHETPDWFLDAKFGIYCHWGPYSVPAHETEWYSHYMYVENHPIRKYHEETYGPLSEFGYKDFIPMFTAENFDADAWAELFKKAGAQFAGPVTEHADGFAMWDSKVTKWNAGAMGPKRDIVGEMAEAIRKQDMKFIATFHHQWNFGWYTTWDKTTDAFNPEFEELYGPKLPGSEAFEYPNRGEAKFYPEDKFVNFWYDKIIEVINKYDPDLIYFDNKLNIIPEQKRKDFLSYYYNYAAQKNQDVVCTYKFKEMAKGSAVLDLERSRMAEKMDFPWLTDDSIDWGSWCHVSEPDYKSTNRLIDFLVDVVSKNGGVLLNVTPTAKGEIPEPVQNRLIEMGQWLQINGEAIYGTRPWQVYGEGPAEVIEGHLSERQNADNTEEDIRFTQKDGALYALLLDVPTKDIEIRSLGKKAALLNKDIKNIELLGSKEKIEWKNANDFLSISVPKENMGEHCVVFKLTF